MSGFVPMRHACSILAVAVLTSGVPAAAQTAAIVLVLDSNAISASAAGPFTPIQINVPLADVGVRDSLPFFSEHEGQRIMLRGGFVGHEGWYAIRSVPTGWATEENTDGLQNFVSAGPGLGSPDAAGNRSSLLESVRGVAPLQTAGLEMLTGRSVCAVVYANEIPRATDGVSLSGSTLGTVAFSVLSVNRGDDQVPTFVDINILDARQVCGGALVPMFDAPSATF